MAMPGMGYDPSGLFRGAYPWTNVSAWGEYGPAISSVQRMLGGPNLAGMTGRATETSAAEAAGGQFQSSMDALKSNMGARGMIGSGPMQAGMAGAFDALQQGEMSGAAKGTSAAQGMQNQQRLLLLQALRNISNARAGGAFSQDQAQLQLQGAQQQADALRAKMFGDIFGGVAGLGTEALSAWFPGAQKFVPFATAAGQAVGGGIGY